MVDIRIARERATSQRLASPSVLTPDRLIAWFGALQSQDYLLARWSIAQRLAAKRSGIDAAVADGSILRTHVLRPTWHFVARDDLRWMQQLTSPRVLALMRYLDGRNGVDATLIARAMKTIAAAIERRGHSTRREIAEALSRAGIKTTAWLVGQLLIHAELRAVVCSGAPAGRHQTYALVDERAPGLSALTRDEALATLTRRYFQSHGPATARDFRWWSGLGTADVSRALQMLGRDVEHVRSGDRSLITLGDRPRARSGARRAHVIQPFDELVVAYSESRDVVDVSGAARRGVAASGAALLTRAVVLDGQIIARWHIGGSGRVVIRPLRRFSAAEREAVAAAIGRFERFFA
jgi:hypothetical protein